PKIRPAYREADESGNTAVVSHSCTLLSSLTAAQDDTADFVPAARACSAHHPRAVLPPIESFDLPRVRFDTGVLKLLDRLCHEFGTQFEIVGLPVALEPVKLGLLWGDEQLEH